MPRMAYVMGLAVVLFCSAPVHLFAAEPTQRIKDFFKPKTLEILTGVERVETFRIKETGKGYEMLAKGAVWKDEKAKQVAALFLDDKSYVWESAKGCDPQPGVMFKLYKGEEFVQAALCFECDMVVFRATDAKGQPIASATEDFDPVRAQWVKWAKEALPDDAVIQGLKEKR